MKNCSSAFNYFRNSHTSPEVRQISEINVEKWSSDFKNKIKKNINEFNLSKQQVVRKAQLDLEEDQQRIAVLQKMKDKEKKVIENTIGDKLKMLDVLQKNTGRRQEKLKLVRSTSREYRENKAKEASRMGQKYQNLMEQMEKHKLSLNNQVQEKIKRAQDKRLKIFTQRALVEQEQSNHEQKLTNDLNERLSYIDKKIEYLKQQKQTKMSETYEKMMTTHHDNLCQMEREIEEHHVSKLGQKLVKSKELIQGFIELLYPLQDTMKLQVQQLTNRQQDLIKHFKHNSELKFKNDKNDKERIQNIQDIALERSTKVSQKKEEFRLIFLQRNERYKLNCEDIMENQKKIKREDEIKQISSQQSNHVHIQKQLQNSMTKQMFLDTVMEKFQQEQNGRMRVSQSLAKIEDTLFKQQFRWHKPLSDKQKLYNRNEAKTIMKEDIIDQRLPSFVFQKKQTINIMTQSVVLLKK